MQRAQSSLHVRGVRIQSVQQQHLLCKYEVRQ